jgi:hypothetical protein
MPTRPPEPGSFEHLLKPVEVEISGLVRLSRQPGTEPWWSRSAAGRFDDPERAFGVCYAAGSVQTAFCESVIHEGGFFVRGRFAVASADLRGRYKISFEAGDASRTHVVLADFTGTALKRLGLNNDISASNDYSGTQAWARAVHDSDERWNGIRYVSRQHNDAYCYALFERSRLKRRGSAQLCGEELDALCDLFGVAEL